MHTVVTEDHYELNMFRIPGLVNEDPTVRKPIVFLQHGLTDSSDCFIVGDPEIAPAFILARSGYDVWLGNSRGNKYSYRYAGSHFSKSKYWDFSF
jgi:hypothetical protein